MKVYLLIEGDRREGEQIFSVHATRTSAIKEIVVFLNEFIAQEPNEKSIPATTRNWRRIADGFDMTFDIQKHDLTAR
jgi:hypothetical protein